MYENFDDIDNKITLLKNIEKIKSITKYRGIYTISRRKMSFVYNIYFYYLNIIIYILQ